MLFYNNEKRAQTGGDIDDVYASNPNRFTHDTQALYLKKLAQKDVFTPNLAQKITCLDIGCGQGGLLHILYNILEEQKVQGLLPSNFYGLDVSEIGIRQADTNYPQYSWIIDSFQEFCTQSTKKLGLDNSFSIILNRGGLTSLESMDEYEAMLNHVHDLLCENGIYFFSQNTNYYRIWMNGMLNTRPNKLKPAPSIFKIASTIFECMQFYKLPGDYIGVYRKRPSVTKSSVLIQEPPKKPEPFAVMFCMNNGNKPPLFVSGDDVAACFLTKYTFSKQELEDFSFEIPPIYQEARMKTEYELSALAKSVNASSKKPRYFISNFHMHSCTTRSIPIIKDFLIEKAEDARFLYFPRRFITIRDICRFYPEIRKGLPDGILLGIGLEDHRFEEECPHPLVDLGEFINRLDWLFDTLLKDNIRPIWCLTRFEENRVVPNSKYFYLAEETKKFNEAEQELCEKYKIDTVDLRDLAKVGNNTTFREEATTRLHAIIKSQTIADFTTRNESDDTDFKQSHYIIPVSGTLIFDDGTSQPLSLIESKHLYYSSPDSTYAQQLNNNIFDIGYTSGVDFFSRSCQEKYCRQIVSSYNKSLPDILILGDSTKMRIRDLTGYGEKAMVALQGQANTLHIGENFGGSRAHVQITHNIAASPMKPVVVHVNAGLHDVMKKRHSFEEYEGYSDINTYGENVRKILKTLKSIPTVKVVIWGTMTPIHPEWHDKKTDGTLQQYVRSQADIIAYNARAVEIAQEEGAWINDLYTAVQDAGLEKCILRDGVHLSNYGATLLGGLVANKIREALKANDTSLNKVS